MYYRIVHQCIQSLKALDTFLNKAEEYASAKKFDANVFLGTSLAPDMRPLVYQVQSACDYVKAGATRLSGQVPPVHENTEKTMPELRARIRKAVAVAESVPEAQYEGAEARAIRVNWMPDKVISGRDYVLQMTIPNVYFHIAMTYAILRNNGVDVGKMDYLEPINFIDP